MGIVQGLTEFLPISSAGHLILVPWLLGWDDRFVASLAFSVMLHLGTLAALLLYFAPRLDRSDRRRPGVPPRAPHRGRPVAPAGLGTRRRDRARRSGRRPPRRCGRGERPPSGHRGRGPRRRGGGPV